MAYVARSRWKDTEAQGLAKKYLRGCEYDAYVPDSLQGRRIEVDPDAAAFIADAEAAIVRLNAEAVALADSEGLARLLLRTEALASSRIEGLIIGGRRLLHAEAAHDLGEKRSDVTAEEVLGNVEAMREGIRLASVASVLTVEHLLELHRLLLQRTRHSNIAGILRETQDWIGGSDWNPCQAAYIPPPPEYVLPLLEDLCAFCNEQILSPLAQAAIAHAQFETIHPFADGNGRIGRTLIHIVLRRRGLARSVVPPISLILATWINEYILGLTATRYLGGSDEQEATAGLNRWLSFFALATRRSVEDATKYERSIAEIQDEWRSQVAPRKGSSADLLLTALPRAPVVSVTTAAELIGRSFPSTNLAINKLVESGVLQQVRIGRRNRAFEARDLIDAFTELERGLASPEGDTLSSPPGREVPSRRNA